MTAKQWLEARGFGGLSLYWPANTPIPQIDDESGHVPLTLTRLMEAFAEHSEAASPPAGPLCDNCGKTSREHYCWLHLPHDEQDFYVPSEKRRAAAPPQGTPAPESGMCEKCGKPKLNLGVTLCTAMLRDPRYAESFCFCTTVLPGHSTVAAQTWPCTKCGKEHRQFEMCFAVQK